MMTPYQILGVSEHANDTEIKQAYLNLVKENPPDRDQERFRQIQQAYQAIKDGDSRIAYELFHLPEIDFNALLDHAFKQDTKVRPMDPDNFYKLLKAVPFDKAIANATKSKAL